MALGWATGTVAAPFGWGVIVRNVGWRREYHWTAFAGGRHTAGGALSRAVAEVRARRAMEELR